MDTSNRSNSSNSSIKGFKPFSFIPGKVFLTEAKQEIAIPQGLDENPLYEQMLVKQMHSEKIITRTGLHKPDENSDKQVWKENYSKQSLELEKIKAYERQKQVNERYDQEMRRQEEKRMKQEEFFKRKYLQFLKKITFESNDPKYLKSPFQPGFYFYEALLANPKYHCSLLHINIPHTFYISESRTYWVTTDEEGRVQSLQDFNKFQVHNSLQKYKDEPLGVIAVFRHPTSTIDMDANPLNSIEFSDKILKGNLPSGAMVQRYIKSHSDRPCTIRLFYNNKNKENRASYAYCITSSQRAMEKYSQTKIIVCSQIIDGIDIYPMHGEAILGLEIYAKEIVEFLQNAYAVRIIDIALDFIKDKDGKCWFIGCKGFNLDESALKCRELRIENEKVKSPAAIRDELEEIREQRLSSMHCKLCLLPFKLFELEHVLPYKMLLLYKRHTRKSGRKSLKLSHIRPLAIDFLSHWVRVCNICHMLVLQEYELMEIEIKLAKKLNISIKPEDLTRKPIYKHPPFLPSAAMQWRVLIYLKNIDYINLKDWKAHNLYLHFNIFEKSHIIKLPQTPHKHNKIRLRRTRLFYFFTQDAAHCKSLCNSEIMKFTMIENKSKIISSGESNPFKLFSCEMEDKESITQLWEIPLFVNHIHFMNLKFVVGLAKDHSINPRKLPVNINKYKTIYMPDDTYFSCEPLPVGWMELFNEKYKEDITCQMLSSSEEIEEVYSPELNEDLIYSSPMTSGKILHVNVDLDPRKKPKGNFSIDSFEKRNFSPSKNVLSPSTSKSQITDLASTRIRSAKHKKTPSNSASTSLTTSAMLLKKPSKSLVSPTYVPNRTSIVSPDSTNCGHSKNVSVDEIYSCKQDITDPNSRIESLLNTVSVYLSRRGYSDKSETRTSPQCSPKNEQSDERSQKKRMKRKVYRDQSNNSYNGKVTSRLNRLLEVYLA